MIKKENMKQWIILIITGVLAFWSIINLNISIILSDNSLFRYALVIFLNPSIRDSF